MIGENRSPSATSCVLWVGFESTTHIYVSPCCTLYFDVSLEYAYIHRHHSVIAYFAVMLNCFRCTTVCLWRRPSCYVIRIQSGAFDWSTRSTGDRELRSREVTPEYKYERTVGNQADLHCCFEQLCEGSRHLRPIWRIDRRYRRPIWRD
jgi:hypothetical protein